jgi:hypothetical protein
MAADPNAPLETAGAIEPRFPASAVPSIKGVRLSPGEQVQLVNISRTGVLVEGRTRFVPGTRVTVVFEGGFAPAQIKGRIVRCQVSSIHDGSLRYQSGIQFDKKLDNHPGDLKEALPDPVAGAAAAAAAAAPGTPAPSAPAAAVKAASGAKQAAAAPQLVNRW